MIFILYYLLHMKMKKMLLGAFLGMFALAWVAVLPNYASAQDASETQGWVDGSSDNPWFESSDAGWWNSQEMKYNAEVAGSKGLKGDALINSIRTAINWVLGLLSLIALALCLWWGFQMMTSGGDSKKYESGLNILKWAAIGLAIIAASWLIVSLIFFVINGSLKWGTWWIDSGATANASV